MQSALPHPTEQQQQTGIVIKKTEIKPTKWALDRLQSLVVINKLSNSAIKRELGGGPIP